MLMCCFPFPLLRVTGHNTQGLVRLGAEAYGKRYSGAYGWKQQAELINHLSRKE